MPATKRALNFTNTRDQSEFNPVHVPAGDYVLKVIDVKDGESNKGNPYWNFVCQLKDRKNAVYPYRCTLNEEALWKIRNLFLACGINVPKKKMNVDPNKIIGKEFGASLEDDEYEGRMKSVIQAVFPADDVVADTEPSEDEEEIEDEIEDEIDVEDL